MDTPTTSYSAYSYQDRIHQQRPDFSRSYNLLADFLLDSYLQAALMTAHELAQALDLDPATVVRFAQSLGYRGYPDLQHELRQRVRAQFLPELPGVELYSQFDHAAQALNLTRRNLASTQVNSLVELLSTARKILVLSDPAGEWLLERLANRLAAGDFPVCNAANANEALAAALIQSGPDDLLLGIDLQGDSSFITRGLVLAKQAGLSVALICGSASQPSSALADIALTIYGADDPPTRLACAAVLINTLEATLQQRFPERMTAAGARLAEVTAQMEASD